MDPEKECAAAKEEQRQTLAVTSRIWGLIKDQWVLIALVVLVVLSSQVQVPEEQQGLKTSVVQKLTIAVIFFINGLTTPTEDLVESIRRWRCHLYVQAMSFFFTSLTMLGLVMALASNRGLMDPELLNGLIVLGCLPTAYVMSSYDMRLGALANLHDATDSQSIPS